MVEEQPNGSGWQDIHEPPVMWPSSDAGFEADSFSPAGTAQLEARFFRGMARRRGGSAAIWTMIGLVVAIPPFSMLVVFLTHR